MVVTSGGTREPIDDVRYIGNVSTGRLGAFIARAAVERGHPVCLVHSRDSVLPHLPEEGGAREGLRLAAFETAADLERILEREVKGLSDPAAVVMAAAVADYAPVRQKGKIPSARDEILLRLKRIGKIVDKVKTWKTGVLLVKFKLESGCGREELLAVGRASARRSQADLMLLNDVSLMRKGGHPAVLQWPGSGRSIDLEGKEAIAGAIVGALEELVEESRGIR